MTFDENDVKMLVLWFFIDHGKFPPDTTKDNWQSKKMSEMQFDDPPLPDDPHYEKKKLALVLQQHFNAMGLAVDSMLELMRIADKTMEDLWKACFESMKERGVFK